jgi:transglutaminase-like putative cysteine protease
MHFRVIHSTRYRYDSAVFLEPHTLRLRPRSDPSQKLLRFDLHLEPAPALVNEGLDAEGDAVGYASFNDTTESLLVRSEFEVETRRMNPFDYLLFTEQQRLPMQYDKAGNIRLGPYLQRHSAGDSPAAGFSESLAQEAGHETLRFLALLTERIYKDWQIENRQEGDSYPADHTFEIRRGACRDVAVLFVECCRVQGIAARFVSGYQEGDRQSDERFMHAWAEVFLPGGGWRGYDPTHGLVVADRHIAVAATADPQFAAPITGTVRGTGAISMMEAEIKVDVLLKG